MTSEINIEKVIDELKMFVPLQKIFFEMLNTPNIIITL